jgi:formylglycine-generating enzyme required for sulfatase activity
MMWLRGISWSLAVLGWAFAAHGQQRLDCGPINRGRPNTTRTACQCERGFRPEVFGGSLRCRPAPVRVATPNRTERGSGQGSGCPAGMAYIPAGTFIMGDSYLIRHAVTLSAYCMDMTEVTVAAYRACTATGCTTPGTGTFFNWGVTDRDNHPINGVDWSQSRAYCQWRGGDLPTEAQWEYAARGTDARTYPWGNAAPASQLCWNRYPGPGSTYPVQSYPGGNSPFGLFDMAGNVWEWTLDFYANYTDEAAIDPIGPTSGTNRVCRGGSGFDSSATFVRAAFRGRDSSLGFRCSRGAT